MLLSQPQLVRNDFFVSLPKKQQEDMVQPFGHFRCNLERQSRENNKITRKETRLH